MRRLPTVLAASFGLVWRAARGTFAAAAALQVLGGVGVAGQLLAGKLLIDRLLVDDGAQVQTGALLLPLGLLALLTAAVAFAAQARVAYQRLLSSLVAHYTIRQIHALTSKVDLLAFESPEFHDRLQRAMVNAVSRPVQLTNGALTFLSSVFASVGVAVALLFVEPVLVLLVFVAYVPTWLATTRTSRQGYSFSIEQTERDRRRLYLNELLIGKEEAKEVRAFGLADFLGKEHERLTQDFLRDLRGLVRRQLRLRLLGSLGTSVLTALAVLVLVLFVTTGRTDVASAATAAIAVVMLGQRLQGLAAGAGALYEGSLFVDDYLDFVAATPALVAARPTATAPADFQRIVVEDVTFQYPSGAQPALQGVSLDIQAGEVVALVGENGSGKTTLAKLLAGLWSPTSGRVLWDDVDVSQVDPDGLRRAVAVIFQDFIRYQLTARENIAAGDHERAEDVEGVRAAAAVAGAEEFVRILPEGFETRLGAEFYGGTELSGGQWQRLALARAFFRDTPFLVLDEPTAALDPRAEHELFETVRTLAAGRTVLLISHRFSSVRSADRIFVMDDGRIVESGRHDELMAQQGLYAELFSLQAAAYLDVSEL